MSNEMINNGLSPKILKSIKELCERYRVKELSMFGSALRDDFSSASDIDLLVEFEPEAQIGFMTLSKMQRELAEILNRQVDLVPKKGLKTKIQESILSSAKVLYAP
jgi:predicted nucleotidyltransferase